MRLSTIFGSLALAGLVLTGCDSTGSGGDSDPPASTAAATSTDPEDDVWEGAVSFEHAVAALPTADELPDGFHESRRCPDAPDCSVSGAAETASVQATTNPTDEPFTDSFAANRMFALDVQQFPDQESADDYFTVTPEDIDAESGEFGYPPEEYEGGGFVFGREGTTEGEAIEIDGWSGVLLSSSYVDIMPPDVRSDPVQGSRVIVSQGSTVFECDSSRFAADGDGLAVEDCVDAITAMIERLGDLDPADYADGSE